MPWKEMSTMDQRCEFVALATQEGANRRELCRRFGISAPTAYKWLRRYRAGGSEWNADLPRRPHCSPGRSAAAIEAAVLNVRDQYPWGARKIARCLEREGIAAPATSTIHAILQRHGRIVASPGGAAASGRFEYPAPNLLWQMDFKGHFAVRPGQRCHPLTVIDDHSRYALCLAACANEQTDTVQDWLTRTFRHYGLPEVFLVDNGAPWGDGSSQSWTRLGVWLLKVGVDVIHSRPFHPQTKGKNERFHRTLKAELLALNRFRDLDQLQRAFDHWRHVYNTIRPHQALGQEVPLSRYRPSSRPMPARISGPEYLSSDVTRVVGTTKAYISFKGKMWKVPQAFCGERIAIRPIQKDGIYGIFFAAKQIATIDLQSKSDV